MINLIIVGALGALLWAMSLKGKTKIASMKVDYLVNNPDQAIKALGEYELAHPTASSEIKQIQAQLSSGVVDPYDMVYAQAQLTAYHQYQTDGGVLGYEEFNSRLSVMDPKYRSIIEQAKLERYKMRADDIALFHPEARKERLESASDVTRKAYETFYPEDYALMFPSSIAEAVATSVHKIDDNAVKIPIQQSSYETYEAPPNNPPSVVYTGWSPSTGTIESMSLDDAMRLGGGT